MYTNNKYTYNYIDKRKHLCSYCNKFLNVGPTCFRDHLLGSSSHASLWLNSLLLFVSNWHVTLEGLFFQKLSQENVKEELHNRFNSISEERVKIFKHNSENLMKIGWKIRKLWHFEVSQIFKKHFLTSRYEYANEWGDDVITSQFSIHFVHRNEKNFIFQLWEC